MPILQFGVLPSFHCTLLFDFLNEFPRSECCDDTLTPARIRRSAPDPAGVHLARRPGPDQRFAVGLQAVLVAQGLASPTTMQFAPDGRLFVAEQGGRLRVIENGSLLPSAFVTLPVDAAGERGLLGIAFDPSFAANAYIYLYYTTAASPVHNRISRFLANGNLAVPGSEVILVDLDNLSSASNHNGGAMHFGPDGKLYVAVGENARASEAQSLNTRLGKMLRLNPDGSIPPDNPFEGIAAGNNRAIWALGLRNPFSFSFRPGAGRMFINDVGSATGKKSTTGRVRYGWPITEGTTADPLSRALYAYRHSGSGVTGCAITVGLLQPGDCALSGGLPGRLLADYCNRWIPVTTFADTGCRAGFRLLDAPALVDVKVSPTAICTQARRVSGDGRVPDRYVGDNTPPTITEHPD
jgi:glucose/arabinose dehydrogenase